MTFEQAKLFLKRYFEIQNLEILSYPKIIKLMMDSILLSSIAHSVIAFHAGMYY